MVKPDGRGIEQITVSDPTHRESSLQLRTSALVEGAGENWQATWNKKDKESIIDVTLPSGGYAGESVILNLTGL